MSDFCPHLGLSEDPETALDFPSRGNLCHRAVPPEVVELEHQGRCCLQADFTNCPVFKRAVPGPLPPELRAAPATQKRFLVRRLWPLLSLALLAVVVLFAWWQFSPAGGSSPVATPVALLPPDPTATPTPSPTKAPTATSTPVPPESPAIDPSPTQTPGATPRPASPTPLPTRTATPLPPTEPPPTPPDEPTPATPRRVSAIITVVEANANVRLGPGLGYPVIAAGPVGNIYTVIGRDRAGEWILLCCWYTEVPGWVFVGLLRFDGGIGDIPVVEDIPPPPGGG